MWGKSIRRFVIRLLSVLHGADFYFCLFTIFIVFVFPEDKGFIWYYTAVLAVAAVSEFCVRRIRYTPIYCLCGGLTIAALMKIGSYGSLAGRTQQIYLAALLVCMFGIRRMNARTDWLTVPKPGYLVCFLAVYFAGRFKHNEMAAAAVYWLAFGYLILYIMYRNLNCLDGFLQRNEAMANFPRKRIHAVNRTVVAGYILGMALVMRMFSSSFISETFYSYEETVLEKIDSMLPHYTKYEWLLMEEELRRPEPEPEIRPQEEAEMQEPHADIFAFLLRVVLYLMIVFGVIMALAVCALPALFLFGQLRSFRRETGDRQEFIYLRKEDTLRERGREILSEVLFPASSTYAVRRIYVKAVRNRRKQEQSLDCLTPAEIENEVGIQEKKNAVILHTIYEKARYSENGCSREDVEALKTCGWK